MGIFYRIKSNLIDSQSILMADDLKLDKRGAMMSLHLTQSISSSTSAAP